MLVQFSVENYLSFDAEQVLSMVATPADKRHQSHLIPGTPRKDDALLRAAALYGANASGKSNLVLAIRFAQELIVNGTRAGQSILLRPFKLSEARRPTKFEFIIKTQGVVYNYGLRIKANRILEEWLFGTQEGLRKKEALFFQRTTSEDDKVDVEFGAALVGRGKRQEQFLQFVRQGTRPNQPFLTEAIDRNVTKLEPIFDWFNGVCTIMRAEESYTSLEGAAHTNEQLKRLLSRYLRVAGTGIEEVETEAVAFDFDRDTPGIPADIRQRVEENVARLGGDMLFWLGGSDGRYVFLKRGEKGQILRVRLIMQHRAASGKMVAFQLEEESEGTQRLIHLLPIVFAFNEAPEQVVIIDELDRRLHTMLSRLLIETALDCDEKHRLNQIIFTTHDTNLLDQELLRRDEIWFVEKNAAGASHLYSLAEFKVRPDLDMEKGYLNGRFGAIPFQADPMRLGTLREQVDGVKVV